ncbi:TPA: hypothetical protein G9E88_004419 [Salmonella enterica]|nr:hypothetical protein [Salmonella enterica subsp. enterica serovar Newport]HAF2586020.1 hypothetical protein [Salmonella enterica]
MMKHTAEKITPTDGQLRPPFRRPLLFAAILQAALPALTACGDTVAGARADRERVASPLQVDRPHAAAHTGDDLPSLGTDPADRPGTPPDELKAARRSVRLAQEYRELHGDSEAERERHKKIFILTQCEYFCQGMKYLFPERDISLNFVRCIEEVKFSSSEATHILLVVDISSIESMGKFKNAIDFINQINSPRRIGVLVNRYNSYLTYYFFRKLKGKVTFFDSHTLKNGIFQRNFHLWLKGKVFHPMHVIMRYCDSRYGCSLKEWLSLILPLSGESMQEISVCMNIPNQTLYKIRLNALHKIGCISFRQFCDLYIRGETCTKNDRMLYKQK